MKKKFILVKTGKEVKIGDNIEISVNFTSLDGSKINTVVNTTLTESLLKVLIESDKIKIVTPNKKVDPIDIWDNALLNLSRKTGWDMETLSVILNTIDSVDSWAAIQIVLKEIAFEINKKYTDSISTNGEIYVISPQDGQIHAINKKTIKNYKVFPAFRTMEDAKIAQSLVKEYIECIFDNAQQ